LLLRPPLVTFQVTLGRAGATAPGEAVQEFERGAIKRAQSLFLNPGGDHPPQQVRREVFRGRAPEHRLPAPPQRTAGGDRTRAISAATAAASTYRWSMIRRPAARRPRQACSLSARHCLNPLR